MRGLSLCFFLSITIWVTPGNQLAKRQLRGFSVLLQDFQGPQRVHPFSCSPMVQMLCIGAVTSHRLGSALEAFHSEMNLRLSPIKTHTESSRPHGVRGYASMTFLRGMASALPREGMAAFFTTRTEVNTSSRPR